MRGAVHGRPVAGAPLVVDAEVHVHETPAALAPFCEMPWRISLETLVAVPENYLDVLGPSGGNDHAVWRRVPPPRQWETRDALRADLDARGVNLALLLPSSMLRASAMAPEDYAAALVRAYNRWLTEEWCSSREGLLGCILACPQDPEATSTEIRHYGADENVVAVCLPSWGIERPWGNRRYDPIFRAAQDAGLAVVLHTGTSLVWPAFPYNTSGFATDFARNAVTPGFGAMVNLAEMMCSGVKVRFPALRIAVLGAGFTWAPFLWNHLDKAYLERRREVPVLSERPSRVAVGLFYGSHPIEPLARDEDYATMARLVHGDESIVFGSGWPLPGSDDPSLFKGGPFAAEVRSAILGGNALRLFGIDETGGRA